MKKILFLLPLLLSANEDILNKDYLSKINLSLKKVEKEAKKLQIDWINPISYSYSYSDDDLYGISRVSTISINQPIFKSGGIYNAIKYSQNLKSLNNLNIKIEKKQLIKTAIELAYNIKKINLLIKKQQNLIDNANIDIKIKKESVFNGLLDISFLNNAIISKNSLEIALIDLQDQKQDLINKFNNISKISYDKLNLPKFNFISLDNWKDKNIYLKQQKLNIKTKHNLKYITYSKYLPTINLTYRKTHDHILDIDNETAGFNIVIPLDFKAMYEPRSARLDELIAKKELQIKQKDEIALFKTIEFKIKGLEKKISLTKQNILAYQDLINQTQEMVKVGLKTEDDLKVLTNSLNNEKLNLEIFNIEKQINLLQLYARLSDD